MLESDVEILLIEDNPREVELTLLALRKHGMAKRVQVARDGAEALELFFGRQPPLRPKLVLLDLKLSKVTGLEVLRRLKQDPKTQMIPVVVLTSSDIESDVTECYRLGANSYLRKPVEFRTFTEAARTIGAYWLGMNRSPP